MHGLGDNLFQRMVLDALQWEGVYLVTPWPELYADMPIRCVRPNTKLRTQAKNVARRGARWAAAPRDARVVRWHYQQQPGSILESLFRELGEAPRYVKPRPFPVAPAGLPGPAVFLRPSTVRAEWPAESRNPAPEYLAHGAAILRGAGLRVHGFADLHGLEERLTGGPQPVTDTAYYAGEFDTPHLFGALAGSVVALGGVGWLAPAALTFGVPLLLVFGGWGGSNSPERIFGPMVDSSKVTMAVPDELCMCHSAVHACKKSIRGFDEIARDFAARHVRREPVDLVA